jgi:hypothetical protein
VLFIFYLFIFGGKGEEAKEEWGPEVGEGSRCKIVTYIHVDVCCGDEEGKGTIEGHDFVFVFLVFLGGFLESAVFVFEGDLFWIWIWGLVWFDMSFDSD